MRWHGLYLRRLWSQDVMERVEACRKGPFGDELEMVMQMRMQSVTVGRAGDCCRGGRRSGGLQGEEVDRGLESHAGCDGSGSWVLKF